MSKKVLILGINGFIGNALAEKIITTTNWQVYGIDLTDDRLNHNLINSKQFFFVQGSIIDNFAWLIARIKECDIILPLIAIATPCVYVKDPLRIFELDFELNLKIIRYCLQYNKNIRVIFPSTSEVYGMCEDKNFDEEKSNLVVGPIHKQRWIYSCSKQMLDRLIYAYGIHQNLQYTIFRPFNWVGPKLDYISKSKEQTARSLTLFISNILYHGEIKLVNGGKQRRSFVYIDDGIEALFKILQNKNNCANRQIFNIGNPANDISIAELVQILCQEFSTHRQYKHLVDNLKITIVDGLSHYGKYYEDPQFRVPCINKAKSLLAWQPINNIYNIVSKTLNYYLKCIE